MWYAYKKVLGIQIGGNTAAQIVSGKGRDVDIANGAYPNEDNLQPGDLLYFRGTDKSRPFSVGHVEIYTKKNECFGHGSGVGPTKKNLKTHCKSRYDQGKGYIKARRFVPGEPEKASETAPTMQPTIKRGSKGTAVKTLQNLLIVLGYNLGKYGADGDFGADTEKALKLYQKDMRLTVDGICGPATWAHITAQKPISPPEKVPETSEGTEPAEAEESEPVEPEKDTNQYVRVTGNTVYVRAQPNTNGEIVSIAQIGDVLAYAGATSADGWHNVVCEGRSAWISGKYAELKAIPGEELPGTVAPDDGRAIIDISAYQTIKDATAAAKMAKHVKLVIHRASVGTAKDTKWAKHAK